MVNYMEIPGKIKNLIGDRLGKLDNIGMSSAAVYLFEDKVLKIQEIGPESENEYSMMDWLAEKLPVPKIIEHEKANKLSYLLMTKCGGEAACSNTIMAEPKLLSKLLADTLHQIWDVDCGTCPVNASLDQKLQQAEYNVIHGIVDMENCEPDTFGQNGFRDPEELLYWLQSNRPNEEIVLSHGDLCLPNIFFYNNTLSGLIDLGRSGTADKWCDIAICYRSLTHNYNGVYTGIKTNSFDKAYFFDALQIQPDWEKIRYYLLLDELF